MAHGCDGPDDTHAPQTFFISRAGADAAIAERIAGILQLAGNEIILEQWDFTNRNFVERMHAAIASPARIVALLSPAYLSSDHCSAEWQNAIAGDPLNNDSRLILLRVADCAPKGLLAGLAYWDLVGVRDNQRLFADVVRHAVLKRHHGARTLVAGPYWRPPGPILDPDAIRPTPSFTGREAELAVIDAGLQTTGIAVVHGMGGTGKSAVAREYAWRSRDRYAVVWWLNAETESGIVDAFLRLGALYTPGLEQSADRYAAARHVWSVIPTSRSKPILLIFDNIDDEKLLQTWRPRGDAHVLATSRNAGYSANVAAVPMPSWPLSDAVTYLRRESGRSDLTADDAFDVAAALHGLPLAVAHAAAYLKRTRTVTARAYLERIIYHLANAPPGAESPRAVFATFQEAIAIAERSAPGAASVACLAAFFSSDDIPAEIFSYPAGMSTFDMRACVPGDTGQSLDLATALIDSVRVAEALGALDRLSLITFAPENRTFDIHRLVQEAAFDLLGDAAPVWLIAAIFLLERAFPSGDFEEWPVCERLIAHVSTALSMLPDAVGFSASASLADSAGYYLCERAAFPAAESFLMYALSAWEELDGTKSPHVSRVLDTLGRLFEMTNRYADAEAHFLRAIAIDEAQAIVDHQRLAAHLNNLGALYFRIDRLDEAMQLYARVLQILDADENSDDLARAHALSNYSGMLWAANRYAEAEPLVRRALDIFERVHAHDHPDVVTVLSRLAHLLMATDRTETAEPLLRRALTIAESTLGADHPGITTPLQGLGRALRMIGRAPEAEPFYQRALAIAVDTYGADHPDVAKALNDLAALLDDLGRQVEAEALYRRALVIDELAFGPTHLRVANRCNNLATLFKRMGNFADAEALYRRSLSIVEARYPEPHPDLALVLANFGNFLLTCGKVVEAEQIFLRALPVAEACYGPNHQRVQDILIQLFIIKAKYSG